MAATYSFLRSMLEAQILKHKGRKAFAVVPYARYKRMLDELDDYACLRALDEAKADARNQRSRPLADYLREHSFAK